MNQVNILQPTEDRLFRGLLSERYDLLHLICPEAAELSTRVAMRVAKLSLPDLAHGVEIGCGTGFTTRALLRARPDLRLIALDSEPTMIAQAAQNLAPWIGENRVTLLESDALRGLREMPSDSLDVVASAYTLHNFERGYRAQVLNEIFRALKPGGWFVNGDRYAIDDPGAHTRAVQDEASAYFDRIVPSGRYDVLQEWIVHLMGDESPERLMRLTEAMVSLQTMGYVDVQLHFRQGVNALVSASKPAVPTG